MHVATVGLINLELIIALIFYFSSNMNFVREFVATSDTYTFIIQGLVTYEFAYILTIKHYNFFLSSYKKFSGM